MPIKEIVHHAGEFLRAGSSRYPRFLGVKPQNLMVVRNGVGGIVGLNEGHGAVPPYLIGRAEHVRILHAGDAQQHVAHLCRIDVLAARDDEVFGTRVHAKKAVAVDGRTVARYEEAVGALRFSRVQVPLEDTRAL